MIYETSRLENFKKQEKFNSEQHMTYSIKLIKTYEK